MSRAALALAALAAVRVAVPLAQLAHADLPGVPRVPSHRLSGDATGYYAAARESIAAWNRIPTPAVLALVAATVAAAAAIVMAWRRRPDLRCWLVVTSVFIAGLVLVVNVLEQEPSGAAVFGWPLVWSIPLLPLRAAGAANPTTAFAVGLPIQLACNVVTLFAIAYAGLYATGRRSVQLLAPAVWASWPFVTYLLAGRSAWQNGTWLTDAGLHMYTEPLSTALVAVALALLLSPQASAMRLALAGCALSFATLVKLSNALVAAAALAILATRYRHNLRALAPYAAGAVSLAPVVLAYWPLGYPTLFNNRRSWPEHPFSLDYLARNWTHSILFDPHVLAIVVPLALAGLLVVRRPWALAILLAFTLVNTIFYSLYVNTPVHPRFLWASLASFFVLWAAGATAIGSAAVHRLRPATREAQSAAKRRSAQAGGRPAARRSA